MDKIVHRFIIIVCFVTLNAASCSDYTENLGGGYKYVHEGTGADLIYHRSVEGGEIPQGIISCTYDKNFIVASQRPSHYPDFHEHEHPISYHLGRDTTYYWLILKKEQKVFGPMDASQFAKLRKQYNVPEKLKVDK